jgi:hypothetical protein
MGAEIERHHGRPILVAGGVQRCASFPDGNGKMNYWNFTDAQISRRSESSRFRKLSGF